MSKKPAYNELEQRVKVLEKSALENERLKKALQESEKQYRILVENAADIIYRADASGVFTFFNPAGTKLTGYADTDLIGKHYTDIIHADYRSEAERFYGRQFVKKIPVTYLELPLITANQKQVWVGQHVQITFEDGQITGFQAIARDITERRLAEEKIKESENRFHKLFEHMSSGIAIYEAFEDGSDFVIRNFNAAAERLEKIKSEEILGRRVTEVFPGIRDFGLLSVFQRVWKSGNPEDHNVSLYQDNRISGWRENHVYKLPSGEIVAIYQDVTDRKQAEEALRESEKRLLGINTNMPGVVFQFYAKDNGEYGISYVSERLADLFEVPLETELDALFPIFIAHIMEEDLDRFVASIQNAVKAVAPWNFEGRYIKPSGKMFWFHAMSVPTRHEDRLVFDGILLDVTERKQAENALRESEELYTRLVDTIPDAVIRTDLNGHILFANDYAFQRGGYKWEEMEGRNILEFVPSEEHERVIQNLKRIMEEGKQGPYEYPLIIKDGSLIPFEVTSGVLRSADGTPGGLVHVCRDITLRQQNEQEKKNLQERLSQAQKMESVGRLAGGVAHDFNNMLGVILGHTELVMEITNPEQPIHSHLREVRKAAERSANLTRQLLAFARKQTVSPMEIDINETVSGMIKMLQRLIGEDIHLSWLPCVNPWKIKIDPSQIDQILANLCVNARDAITGVGRISIELGNISINNDFCADHPECIPGDYIFLAVSDDGCGMSKEIQDKLFEPFFTTKDVGKGTGLGLSTVYGIVKQNNGFINVYSEPGQGTTFRIYLPRHIGKSEKTKIEKQQELVFSGRETVLVVEDESAILDLIKIMLEQQGYDVRIASTPGEAIQMAEEHNGEIHLLITDVVMPEMNGRDLAKRILSLYPNIKRLFMSGYTDNMIAHHGVLDEGVCFIQKPFSRKDLTTKVREVLDQK
ncbi:MAG: PAS domain S-box protein [Smithella sp.]|jgi:PAS domain S-box-containing protein